MSNPRTTPKHRAPTQPSRVKALLRRLIPGSRDGALVVVPVVAVVAAILALSGAVVVSPDVAPVAMETAVCQ